MTNSFFYLQIQKNSKNHQFIDDLEPICNETKEQAYLINKPLADPKYSYGYEDAAVLLMPKHKITFLNFSNDREGFDGFIADFIEDLGSISDKFRYKDFIGRPRSWDDLLKKVEFEEHLPAAAILERFFRRICVDFGLIRSACGHRNARSSPQSSGRAA